MMPDRLACIALVVALVPASLALAHDAGESAESAERLGVVHFETSCTPEAQRQFDRALAMLHSFWYPETVKAFTGVTQTDPNCAIAYWGLALSHRPNPFAPPDAASLQRGWDAVQRGRALGTGTQREKDFLAAVEPYFKDFQTLDQRTRTLAYENAMRRLHEAYPTDSEAAVYYALALDEAALITGETTLARQLQAAEILEAIWKQQPEHPGVAHYLIHTYDDPRLARRGLDAANRYGNIAPAAPHALHMPAHIYSMLGMWDQSIVANRASMEAAREYGRKNSPGSHDPYELHAMDFMTFAYLQLGQDKHALALVEERNRVTKLVADRVSVGIMLSIIPARYAVERQDWRQAAALEPRGPIADKHPQAEAITWFTRGIGAARTGDLDRARASAVKLGLLKAALEQSNQVFWVAQAQMQIDAVNAWIALAEARNDDALRLMRSAVEIQARAGRHPAIENRLVPMRELLGDMLLAMQRYEEAAAEFEESLVDDPNRFRGYYGAAAAYRLSGSRQEAAAYYAKLLQLTATADTVRPEMAEAQSFVESMKTAGNQN
jgi:tetratricopeptide (TPR) repeat protein